MPIITIDVFAKNNDIKLISSISHIGLIKTYIFYKIIIITIFIDCSNIRYFLFFRFLAALGANIHIARLAEIFLKTCILRATFAKTLTMPLTLDNFHLHTLMNLPCFGIPSLFDPTLFAESMCALFAPVVALFDIQHQFLARDAGWLGVYPQNTLNCVHLVVAWAL